MKRSCVISITHAQDQEKQMIAVEQAKASYIHLLDTNEEVTMADFHINQEGSSENNKTNSQTTKMLYILHTF